MTTLRHDYQISFDVDFYLVGPSIHHQSVSFCGHVNMMSCELDIVELQFTATCQRGQLFEFSLHVRIPVDGHDFSILVFTSQGQIQSSTFVMQGDCVEDPAGLLTVSWDEGVNDDKKVFTSPNFGDFLCQLLDFLFRQL